MVKECRLGLPRAKTGEDGEGAELIETEKLMEICNSLENALEFIVVMATQLSNYTKNH